MAKTLFDRIWDSHVVHEDPDGPTLLYVDLHLIHEVTSAQAFEGLRLAGRRVRRPDLSVATMDHNVPTDTTTVHDPLARTQLDALRVNCEEFGVPLYATGSGREGIVHVIGPSWGSRSRDDGRLRRQPYVDPRCVRVARVRGRDVGGRARTRHAEPPAAQAEDDARPLLG